MENSKLTFVALSRGRYRCIQTGKITRDPKNYAIDYAQAQEKKALKLKNMLKFENAKTKANVVVIKRDIEIKETQSDLLLSLICEQSPHYLN